MPSTCPWTVDHLSETDQCDLGWIDHTQHALHAAIAEIGDGMVGSRISAFLSRPARARETRSRRRLISSATARVSASWIAGANNPPPRSEIAIPRWTAGDAAKWSSSQNPFISGTSRQASAAALNSSAAAVSCSPGGRPELRVRSQLIPAARSIVVDK